MTASGEVWLGSRGIEQKKKKKGLMDTDDSMVIAGGKRV